MLLTSVIRFQKTLALAAAASNDHEATAAELAARRLMETCNIDPTAIPNASLYSRVRFDDNALLNKLRTEWHEQHPPPTQRTPPTKVANGTSVQIPFNIDGFRKHTRKRKKLRAVSQDRVSLTIHDQENIRQLFNEGRSIREIADLTSIKEKTVNSTRWRYYRKEGKWILDGNGHFQWAEWADPFREPEVSS